MKISERLQSVTQIFLDTAPVIYFVEKNPRYVEVARVVFNLIDSGSLSAVTSPVTLAECLTLPYRLQQPEVAKAFIELLVNDESVRFVPLDDRAASKAAELRARYNLPLPDSFQIAVAILSGCDAVLTNDVAWKKVAGINAIVLDEMEAE